MTDLADRRWLVLTVVCVLLSLILPTLTLHGYVKFRVEKRISGSDSLAALANIFWLAFVACQIGACANGFGTHTADLPGELHYLNSPTTHNGDVTKALQFWYLTTLLHVLSSATARLAIGLSAISPRAFPSRRRLVITNISISATTSAIFFFLILFQCNPISTVWSRNRIDAQARCYTVELRIPWYTFLSISMATDAALGIFAMASLVRRDISWKRRAITGVFNCFAACHVACTAMQITHVPDLENFEDLTWSAIPFSIYALVGPTLAVLGVNATKIAPLALKLRVSADLELLQELPGEREGGRVAMRRSFPLVMLHGRNGNTDEDEALAAVVEEGIARLAGTTLASNDSMGNTSAPSWSWRDWWHHRRVSATAWRKE